jgi:hypothetical protein
MQTLTFTPEGFLTPFEKINVDLATFERTFVTDFPNSETRKTLFYNYLRYIDSFSKEITPNFTQWIDGSFVTQKENPNDIDLVTFIDQKYYIQNDESEKLDKFFSFSWENEKIDAYIVGVFTKNTSLYENHTIHFQNQWNELFITTRATSDNQIFQKGFIEIIF